MEWAKSIGRLNKMKLENISITETLRYMGVRGTPDAQTSELVEQAEKLVRERISPKYVYRVGELSFTDMGVCVSGMDGYFGGVDIKNHLKNCKRIVILAATLTPEADMLIRRAAISGAAEALATDAVCSAAIEQVCDRAEKEIFSQIDAHFRTWRFSPGYGDFPIESQRIILDYLNASRRIGLTLTDSCLMIPSKSVTAVIGISDTPLNWRAKGCATCSMRKTCAFKDSRYCCSGNNN